MSETGLDVPRLWLEYADPEVDDQWFRVDLTWLTSTHRCVFPHACPGIYKDRPDDGCCTLGAEFTDEEDLARVTAAVEQLDEQTWQWRAEGLARGWHEPVDSPADPEQPTQRTRRFQGACILLNRPGFATGPGCALHVLASTHDVPPMRYKPDVCWQLPIRRSYRTVTRPDDTSYLEVSIGEYDRRAWGPGGHDLDWYCTGSPLSHGHDEPLYRSHAAELTELMGLGAYQVAAQYAESLLAAAAALAGRPDGRADLVRLVHPASLAAEGLL